MPSINAGEFFSLLGPSGCGKTTTLRMIAGFERPTSGEILLDGDDVAVVPPHERNVHTVFQNYALFPHLNVYDNIAFGLRRHKVAKDEIRQRVEESLRLVELHGLGGRRPRQLSGGQQQRVALARALVLRPAVLLLDEPLGALDAKIRKQLRVELKALQEEVGITFVFVTHDQEEALSMSDRVAVMSNGRIEQIGTPDEVYENPATVFVADFLGVSNLMDAEPIAWDTGECTVRIGEFSLARRCGDTGSGGRSRSSPGPSGCACSTMTATPRPAELPARDRRPNDLRRREPPGDRPARERRRDAGLDHEHRWRSRLCPGHPGDGPGPPRRAARARPERQRPILGRPRGIRWRRRAVGARRRRRISLNSSIEGDQDRPGV